MLMTRIDLTDNPPLCGVVSDEATCSGRRLTGSRRLDPRRPQSFPSFNPEPPIGW
jgi:hypothetical protein